MMQTMFWPSACAIYFGLLLLVWDLSYEEFSAYLRALIGVLIVLVACVFTVVVVLRKAPVFSDFQINRETVLFVLRNDSLTDDYRSIDLTIWPDGDNGSLVVSAEKQTNGYPAQIVNSSPDHISGKRPNCPPESALIYSTGKEYVMLSNTIRVRAEVLPVGGYVEVTSILGSGNPRDAKNGIPTPSTDVKRALVDGNVSGPFRQFHIHQYLYHR